MLNTVFLLLAAALASTLLLVTLAAWQELREAWRVSALARQLDAYGQIIDQR